MKKIILTCSLLSVFLVGCDDSEKNLADVVIETESTAAIEIELEKIRTSSMNEFLNLKEYALSSEFSDFGETLNSLEKISDNLFVGKGSYASGVLFYRVYSITDDEFKIVYETTNEKTEEYFSFEKSEDKANYQNKNIVLLKAPLTKGNEWLGGKIQRIYSQGDSEYVEVVYSNGNTYLFEKNNGIKKITYTLPTELKEIYRDFETEIVAK